MGGTRNHWQWLTVLGLLWTQLFSSAALAQSVSFELPSSDVVNRANVAFLAFGGACSNPGSQVTITGPSAFSATAPCQASGRWEVANVSLTQMADGALAFTARHMSTAQASRTLRKDTVAPTLALQQPTNGSTIDPSNSLAVPVRGTCGELNQPVVVRARPASSTTPVVERQLTCLSSRSFSTTLDVSSLPDGDTQILVQHQDASGNTTQQDIILYKDTVPLQVTIDSLGEYIPAARSASLQPHGTCNKVGEALYLDVTSPSGYVTTLLTFCGADQLWEFANVSVVDAPDEELTFTATLTHSLTGAAVSAWHTAIKDVVPPVLALSQPATGERVTATTGTALRVSGTCSESTAVSISAGTGAVLQTPCSAGAFSTLYEVGALPDGDVALRVSQADLAGNSSRQDLSVLKDVTPATVSVTAPAAGSFVNAALAPGVTFSGTCSESGAFAQPVLLSGAFSATAQCSAGTWSLQQSLTQLPEGPLQVRVSHGDAAGNPPAQVTLDLVKDVTPPTLQLTSPSPAPGPQQVLVNASNLATLKILGTCSESGRALSVSGAVTGTATCTAGAFSYPPDLSGVTDGDVLLDFTLTDAAGNSTTQSLGLYKDTQPPTVTLAGGNPLLLSATSAPDMLLSGSCSEHGTFAAPVRVVAPVAASAACNSGTWSLRMSFAGLADGNGSIQLEHTDRAGNTVNLTRAYTKDTVPPTLSLAQPAPGYYVNASTASAVRVAGTCNENGRSVELSGPVTATAVCNSGHFSTDVNLSGAPEGDVTLRARLADAAGNATVQDVRVLKDTLEPTLALSNVGDPLVVNATTSGELYLLGSCSENATSVKLTTPVAASAACSGVTWSLLVSLSDLPDGTGNLVLEHSDVAGNTARVTRAYSKDTVAPLLTLTRPAPGDHVNASTVPAVQVSGTCNENGRSVEITQPVTASAPCTSGLFSLTLDLRGVPEGNVSLRTRLTDAAGNAAVQDVLLLKDTVVPTLTLANTGNPLQVAKAAGTPVVLSGTCSERSPAQPVKLVSPVTASATCNSGSWSLQVDSGVLPLGNGSLQFTHGDAAGNTGQLTRAYFRQPSGPVLSLTSGVSGGYVTINYPYLQGTCSENNLPVELLAPVVQSTTCRYGSFGMSLSLYSIPDGPMTLRLRHTNAAGESTTVEVPVIKDTVAPTLTLTQPTSWDLGQSGTLALQGTCSESGRPVTFRGVFTGDVTCTPEKTFAVTVPLTAWGTLPLTLEHRDAAGLVTTVTRSFERCQQYPAMLPHPRVEGRGTFVRADFNADGVTDMAQLVTRFPAVLKVYLGRATGGFDAPASTPISSPYYSDRAVLNVVDLNADGALDLLVTGRVVGSMTGIYTYEGASLMTGRMAGGRPAGTFNPPFVLGHIGSSYGTVAAAHINNDGILDIVMVKGSPEDPQSGVSVSYGHQACGPGIDFDPPVLVHQKPPLTNGYSSSVYEELAVADLNEDGLSDIALIGQLGAFDVLLRTSAVGAPAFQRSPITLPAGQSFMPRKLIASDLNGDSRMDLAALNYGGNAAGVAYGQGGGTFTPLRQYSAGDAPVDLAAEDVDGDGRRDLIVGGFSGVSLLPGQPGSAPGGYDFGPARGVPTENSVEGVAVVNVNPDAIPDVVTSEAGGLGIYPRSMAALEPDPYLSPVSYGAQETAVANMVSADFNADGIEDLAAVSNLRLSVLLGNGSAGVGNGTFGAPTHYAMTSFTRLASGDFNRDGAIDLAAVNTGNMAILLGNRTGGVADGTFASPVLYPLRPPTTGFPMLRSDELVAADFDGDGILDLLWEYGIHDYSGKGQYAQIVLSVSFGTGNGTFEPELLLPQLVQTYRLVVRDFNQDGRADVAFAVSGYDPSISGYRYEARKLLGTGNRSAPFGPAIIHPIPSSNGSSYLIAGDFNADGTLDLMTDLSGTLLFGTAVNGVPTGDFTASATLRVNSILQGGKDTVSEDYNLDGALDIIVSQVGRVELVRRWVGAPGVRFVTHFTYTTARNGGGLVVKDFNEDGVPDIAYSSPGVTVMLGRKTPGLTASP